MNELASTELADFLRFCRPERRLAPMTCSAYERDVSACLAYLQGEGIEALAEAKVTHLRAFLASEQNTRPAASSQARTTAELLRCIRLCLDCADVCEATGKIVTRQTEPDLRLVAATLEACVRACRVCAEECDRHAAHHKHCRICAEVCRRCEASCADLLAKID
jgi:hypothetical protein